MYIRSLLFAIILLSACSPNAGYDRFQTQQTGYFDSFIIFTGYAQSEEDFTQYADILFDKLSELHRQFDIFNSYEGVNNLYYINANAGLYPVVADQVLIDMLMAAQEAYRLTMGRTNVAMGSVLRIWHKYRTAESLEYKSLPSMDALLAASLTINMEDIIIDPENNTVFFKEPDLSLDVGSIAKGYAAGLAMEAVARAGIHAALLNAGGHIVAYGKPPGRDTWNIGIQNPELYENAPSTIDTLSFTNASLSVSGGYKRYFEVNGLTFGHIIDPDTLMPANRFKQVAVWHPSSWMADVLSTALFILPLEEGYQLITGTGGEAFWICTDGKWTGTQGYKEMSAGFGDDA